MRERGFSRMMVGLWWPWKPEKITRRWIPAGACCFSRECDFSGCPHAIEWPQSIQSDVSFIASTRSVMNDRQWKEEKLDRSNKHSCWWLRVLLDQLVRVTIFTVTLDAYFDLCLHFTQLGSRGKHDLRATIRSEHQKNINFDCYEYGSLINRNFVPLSTDYRFETRS